MKMIIHKPEIVEAKNNRKRLQAYIEYHEFKGGGLTVWYEVDEKYAEFLTVERADAFLVAILPYAMVHSTDDDPIKIIIKQEISEKLYYMLTWYYIPILVKNSKRYSEVVIDAPYTDKRIEGKNCVATGVSGGVDSTYTVLKHLKAPCGYKLTHGLFMADYKKENVLPEMNVAKTMCRLHNLEFIHMTSNLCGDLYREIHSAIIATFLMSHALSLQKLISVYYYSSSYAYTEVTFKEHTMASYDILSIQCLSTEKCAFYSPGLEAIRVEKVKYIANYEEPREYLMVCREPNVEGMHCGKCSKCSRTMLELYAVGALEKFENKFNVKDFYKNINDHLAYVIMKRKKDVYAQAILAELKRKKIRVPIKAWIDAFIKWKKHGFKTQNPHYYDYLP